MAAGNHFLHVHAGFGGLRAQVAQEPHLWLSRVVSCAIGRPPRVAENLTPPPFSVDDLSCLPARRYVGALRPFALDAF
eukprot:6026672-Prymnesium_polylepis.2